MQKAPGQIVMTGSVDGTKRIVSAVAATVVALAAGTNVRLPCVTLILIIHLALCLGKGENTVSGRIANWWRCIVCILGMGA